MNTYKNPILFSTICLCLITICILSFSNYIWRSRYEYITKKIVANGLAEWKIDNEQPGIRYLEFKSGSLLISSY